MLVPRKILFSLFLLIGVSIYAQQNTFVSSDYTDNTILLFTKTV